MKKVYAGLLLTILMLVSTARAASQLSDDIYPPSQKVVLDQQIQKVLSDKNHLLVANQQQNPDKLFKRAIQHSSKELFNPASPGIGPIKTSIYLIEFFDYRCGYCKKANTSMHHLIQNNQDIRFIFKEFPIFGGASELMARAALAAHLQHQYLAMHDALMALNGDVQETALINLAKKLNLDVNRFTADLRNNELIEKELQSNYQLGKRFGLDGTPIFIMTGWPLNRSAKALFIAGLPTQDELQKMINEVKHSLS